MASSSTARVPIRVAFALLIVLAIFYVGRPLYWKLSATVHEIREKKTTVKEGISQFVMEARRSVGWGQGELEVGDESGKSSGIATARRILWSGDSKRIA
ncbi:hypothetical protein Syun_029009 [Stephania yunnanensis]|uniref:Uncharacterized protein n=1 Tax=Stephania yunnanensis TaxID=152371 RepID=A0AAP0E4S9_9MAGN